MNKRREAYLETLRRDYLLMFCVVTQRQTQEKKRSRFRCYFIVISWAKVSSWAGRSLAANINILSKLRCQDLALVFAGKLSHEEKLEGDGIKQRHMEYRRGQQEEADLFIFLNLCAPVEQPPTITYPKNSID